MGFFGGSDDKENQVQSLGQEYTLEEGTATYCSILAWRIPWTEEPGGLRSMGSQRVKHDRATEQQQSWLTKPIMILLWVKNKISQKRSILFWKTIHPNLETYKSHICTHIHSPTHPPLKTQVTKVIVKTCWVVLMDWVC